MLNIPENPTCLLEISGHALIGLSPKYLLASIKVMYVLPMLTILTKKENGIEINVGNNPLDDCISLLGLRSNISLRANFDAKNV